MSHPSDLVTIENCSDNSLDCLSSNLNLTSHDYSTLKLPVHLVIIYGFVYFFIFLCALIGNIMVVVVVVRTPRMHTVTNFFIISLAVADILVAVFCIPMTFLDNIFSGWPFQEFLCKMTPYVQGVCVCASAYILVAIAIDRYLAICSHPRWRIMKRGAVLILFVIWIFSLLLQIPWAVYYEHWPEITRTQTIYMCGGLWPDFDSQRIFFVVAIVVGTYLLPLSFIFVCYILIAWHVWHRQAPGVVVDGGMIKRCRRNIIKMLITVVLMFSLSWMPLHVIYLNLYFNPPSDKLVLDKINDIGIPLAQLLELSNSGMNAFIYSFFSGNFRHGFAYLCCCGLHSRDPFKGRSRSQRVTRSLSADVLAWAGRASEHRKQSLRLYAKNIPNSTLSSQQIHQRSYIKTGVHSSTSCPSGLSVEKENFYV